MAISDAKTITGHGYFTTSQGNVHSMFRVLGDNSLQIIPGPVGDRYQVAYGLDEEGTLYGLSVRADNSSTAIRYSDAGGLEYLNNLVPAGSDWNLDPLGSGDYLAGAVTGNSQRIIGSGYTGNSLGRGFSLSPGSAGIPGSGSIKAIPMIPRFAADTSSYSVGPYDVNTAGEVVGGIFPVGSGYPVFAFIWVDGTGTVELNNLIDPASGWQLDAAFAINDRREIAGYGHHNGRMEAFKMTVPNLSPCPGADLCHTVAPRDLRTGSCAAPVPVSSAACQSGVTLRFDGVVDVGGGKVVAVFGFKNTSTLDVHPASNVELINGVPISNPQPVPPIQFPPGDHPGAFLPSFNAGQTITWTVDGESVSASALLFHPPTVPIGPTGLGVQLGTTLVTIKPDVELYKTPPQEGTAQAPPTLGVPFLGALNGSLSVGPSGAAIYTVPIAIPPGIAGMAPNLSLVYNSQGSNGIAGQGWDLTGLSIVHRCPKTRLQDGSSRPVMMDELVKTDGSDSDGVCLDGQRLFEDPPGSGIYRTERVDFSKIERDDVLGLFRVTTKAGEVRYYGSTADSKMAVPRESGDPNAPPSTATEIAVWALSKVFDAWGNYYDVHYFTDPLQNGVRVSEIDYTGHFVPPDIRPTSDPYSFVKFAYEPRGDVRKARFRSTTIPRNQRLKTITTPRGQYELTYNDDLLRGSTLQQITYACQGATCTCTGTDCIQSLSFTWNTAAPVWVPTPALGLPTTTMVTQDASGFVTAVPGTQFVDVNGDGRLDLILAKTTGSGAPTQYVVWQNTGTGWAARSDWQLPDQLLVLPAFGIPPATIHTYLANINGQATGVRFADVDGDGLADLIQDHANVMPCSSNSSCTQLRPAVWLNRNKQGDGWQLAPQFGTPPTGWNDLTFSDGTFLFSQIRDMNGDGRADLVRVIQDDNVPGTGNTVLQVALNTGSGWQALPDVVPDISLLDMPKLEDANGDGVPDLVRRSYFSDSAGVLRTWDSTNLTLSISSSGLVLGPAITRGVPTGTRVLPPGLGHGFGDIDGDGVQDAVFFYHPRSGFGSDVPSFSYSQVGFGDGSGISARDASGYLSALKAFAPSSSDALGTIGPNDFGYALADINADGLVDLIRSHAQVPPIDPPRMGQILYNTGDTWKPQDGATGWDASPGINPVPLVPDEPTLNNGSQFLDLNGDGVVDLGFASNVGFQGTAWLNNFSPPVITSFPNGVARVKTAVHYDVITTAAAQAGQRPTYSDSTTLDSGTTFLALPMRVVTSVDVDDGTDAFLGVGTPVTTKYQYADLRGSASGRGPQGFKSMTVSDPSGIVTKTTFAQAYPYSGMPTLVEKWTEDSTGTRTGPVAKTETKFCDRIPIDDDPCTAVTGRFYSPRTSLFVYPISITDTSYLRTSVAFEPAPAWTTTTTEYVYDSKGNPQQVVVTMESSDGLQKTRRSTANLYSSPGSNEERIGKATQIIVSTQRLLPAGGHNDSIFRTSRFQYRAISVIGGLALTKSQVEPDAAESTGNRLDTAYDYDIFGNVTTTTACANDFGNCVAGAVGPGALPYRTTLVSYDPASFVAPTGSSLTTSLAYTAGRFPVKSTTFADRINNPSGYSEYSAYDPLLGVLIQRTGPNGITSCHKYDSFGNLNSVTDRCGSLAPITTTTRRYRATADLSPLSRITTVTTPATGSPSWVYTDGLGRQIIGLTRSFDGGFIETATEYDHLGRVHRTSKPFLTTDVPNWTTSTYDPLGRLSILTQDLGQITDAPAPTTTSVFTTYNGTSISTQQTVNGQVRQRTETKNLLGKVASVQDANNQTISFGYDADGNLSDTFDPTNRGVHVEYDIRGRKILTRDPDLGDWSYAYDGFGDLLSQVDAKGQSVSMTYDQLGRMTTKTDGTGTAQWVYDVASGAGIGKLAAMISAPDARLMGTCAIPNIEVGTGSRAVRYFNYTSFGDVSEAFECADGETFSTQHVYDDVGRDSVLRYPEVNGTRFAVRYNYNSFGYLRFVGDDLDNSVYWAAKSMNALGQVTSEIARNGVETTSVRNPSTGWLRSSSARAHADHDTLIQSWSSQFDEAGNLRTRSRSDEINVASSAEVFEYDLLDRITSSRVTVSALSYDTTESYGYDPLGNLTLKGGNTYAYTGCMAGDRTAGPHAVCQIGSGASYTYDANGNMLTGSGRTVDYNPSNKSIHIGSHPSISHGNDTGDVDIMYGADGNRVVEAVSGPSGVARTVYVGLGATGRSSYERTVRGTTREHIHFIYAGGAHGGNAFALRVVTDDGSTGGLAVATRYNQFDHLGSVTGVSDESGHVISAAWGGPDAGIMGYDAWGARRAPEGRAADWASFDLPVGRRGFTGHESIPNVGLINMNGRVYDPVMGRFLTPDPTVQYASDLQNYNRYTYVGNNPLRYTDPTGYNFMRYAFDSRVRTALMVTGAVACAAASGGACLAATYMLTVYSIGAMHMEGSSFAQIVTSVGVQVVAGGFGGAIGGAIVGSGADVGLRLLGGAIGGAVSSTMATLMTGGGAEQLGWSALIGAASGAATAGLQYAVQTEAPVSQASASGAQGEGGDDTYSLGKGTKTGPYRGGPHDPVFCGQQGIACGGPANPYIDRLAREGFDEPVDVNAVDEGDSTVQRYTIQHPREAMALVYEDAGGDVRYLTKIGSTSEVQFAVPADSNLLAIAHTHPGSMGEIDSFSVLDVNTAARLHVPNYVWQQSTGDVLVFTPRIANAPANIRALPE